MSASIHSGGSGGGGGGSSPLLGGHHGRQRSTSAVGDSLRHLTRSTNRSLRPKIVLSLLIGGALIYLTTFGRNAQHYSPAPKPQQLMAKDGTSLTTFLDQHFPRRARRSLLQLPTRKSTMQTTPHIWLTLSDSYWAETGVLALHTFVERLNVERRAAGRDKDGRETKLVVLCLNEECMRTCEAKGLWAYGGFIWSRPPKILVATWPKLASLIEVLQTRDVFFVDADVSFRYDPYPHMEPYMQTHDLIAQENESFDHFNTGWMWIKQSKAASDAWNEVLKMDLFKTSRDQNNFNEVLNTTDLRRFSPSTRLPLKMDFVAQNGLKVHVLDPGVFRSHHFEADLPFSERHESVAFHMTCGDDSQTKVYVAKSQGFWGDVEHYYDDPPLLVTIDHLGGTKAELVKLMKILIMAAHYSDRALLPPQYATFTDFPPNDTKGVRTHPTRKIYSAFPMSHISRALGITVLEPLYAQHAMRWLIGGSVLGAEERRRDEGWSRKDERERARLALSLGDVADLDLRHVTSFAALHRLMTSSSFASRRTIRLINHDYPPGWAQPDGATNWREWPTSAALDNFATCHLVESLASCEGICRFDGPRRIEIGTGWERLKDLPTMEEERD